MRSSVSRQLQVFADEIGDSDPVAVEGRRTRWLVGGAMRKDTRLVTAPQGLVDYRPEEMTVRVNAGTMVSDLHCELSTRRQRTALPKRGGTVGGAIAIGENDVNVLRHGRVRDAVLQLRYVSAEGQLVSGGGPTVKNVSGFDLPRLMVGALGTLGLFAEAVLRTQPLGEMDCWYVGQVHDPFLLLDCLYRPSAVLWDGEHTWVHLEGHRVDVEAQAATLTGSGPFEQVEGPPPLPSQRWSLRPSELRHIDRSKTGRFIASVGVGLVYATLPAPRPVIASASSAKVAARAKALFDPKGRLNPGRVPGGR